MYLLNFRFKMAFVTIVMLYLMRLCPCLRAIEAVGVIEEFKEVTGGGGEGTAGEGLPYGGSYLVEDTCQFSLCGPLYRQEFGVGKRPLLGSCSGDCHLLAINTNTNRFTKEFLWQQCARMCAIKYNTTQYRWVGSNISNCNI